ncbi:MAG: hypothetical protein JWO38_2344, partial [Gemmataceae bacterium]|nr:hypothetical protein [Gemmataceae bacterium]
MPSLAVTDLANGTGATATIAGSAGGANTVYVQLVTGTIGSGSWSAAGTL